MRPESSHRAVFGYAGLEHGWWRRRELNRLRSENNDHFNSSASIEIKLNTALE
jgi:hypothetical protein